jgi:energy-coupling factor transport system ATP-binding protein
MINVIAGVILGPAYAVAIAFIAAVLRNMLGLGTLLAFPGGMIGAFLAGLAYRFSRNAYAAGIGEVLGTGLLGALASAWLVGPVLMEKSMAAATLVIAFSISGISGAIIGIIALSFLRRVKMWQPESNRPHYRYRVGDWP